MAILLNKKTNKSVFLRSHHVFGRHPGSANTLLTNPEASRIHASILWNGSFWTIKDSSSNGTYINAEMLLSGSKTQLNLGDRICFGALDNICWVLSNDNAPKSMLMPIKSDAQAIELEGVVGLPNENNPEITLYQEARGKWLCENSSGIILLEAGSKVSTENNSWYFINAETIDETVKVESNLNKMTKPSTINFTVSRDEEHVSLRIVFENKPIDLGERTHHYLVLLIARKRIADRKLGVEESEQGWIDKDQLSQQLGLDENHINIQIYRLRKQLMQINPSAVQLLQIIERRRGEIRFGFETSHITVNV